MLRRYDEEQMRSLGGALEGERLPATFAQQFLWHRKLSLTWSPTTSLSLTYASGTDARIEEPHRQVNRALNPDGWRIWQDSVRRSIREGGTPVHYGQNASLTYQLPTALIAPPLQPGEPRVYLPAPAEAALPEDPLSGPSGEEVRQHPLSLALVLEEEGLPPSS